MEIVINPEVLFSRCEPEYMSGSVAELGPCAGEITWRNCLEASDHHADLFEGCDFDALRDHFREYGAWEDSEIDAWSERSLRAMAIQEIAADYRNQIDNSDTDDFRHRYDSKDGLIYAYFGI